MSGTGNKTPHIFINYRRALCKAEAILIRKELINHFGHDNVFLDSRTVIPGDKWKNEIFHHLNRATIMLSLIPKKWIEEIEPNTGGQRRIDMQNDWVRLEIKHCIEEEKVIIPILLEGGVFPEKNHLPPNIQNYTDYQSTDKHIRIENLENDILNIVNAIKKHHNIDYSNGVSHVGDFSNTLDFSDTSHFFNKRRPELRYGEISCNRNRELRLMKDHFENNKNEHSIHYFLSGNPKDKLDSLIERFVIEVLSEDCKFDMKTEELEERILIKDAMPTYGSLANCQKAFGEYFTKRFFYTQGIAKSEINSLGDFNGMDHPIHQMDYIITVFEFDDDKDKHELIQKYFEWIISGFCNCSASHSKHIFFYTCTHEVEKKSIFSFFKNKKRALIKNLIHNIVGQFDNCLQISEFSLVKSSDIEKWFGIYTSNTRVAELIIEDAKNDQQYAQYYNKKEDAFSMHVVELFLRNTIKLKVPRAL